jgi:hypothetical protein
MQIELLHYKLEREWDKLSNKHRRYLTPLEKDEILNMSIDDYFDLFAHGRNEKGFQLGFEETQQRIDMLHTLVRSWPEEPVLTPVLIESGIYLIDFDNLQDIYGSFDSARVTVTGCPEDFKVILEQHSDLGTVLQDYHRKPSKVWKRIPGTIRNNKLYLYTNEEFVPEAVKITYLKRPNEVCLGTYTEIPTVDLPGPPIKPKVDCDLPDRYVNLLMTIAAQNLSRLYGQPDTHSQKVAVLT